MPVRCLVINLPLAWERREAIEHEFSKVGLTYELWAAVDGHRLTDEDHRSIDHDGRRRLGLRPLDNSSVACLLSHLSIVRHLAESEDDMVAIFEDDARLHPDLPDVLDALDGKSEKFDIVKLQRNGSPPYYPVYQLLPSHSLGRVRYYDRGGYGYVITRHAARHLLERFPTTYWEIDQLIPRFWDNGLMNVLYVNPPVVYHDDVLPSYIEAKRLQARLAHRRLVRRSPVAAARRLYAGAGRSVRRWFRFRELRRRDRDIDPYGF